MLSTAVSCVIDRDPKFHQQARRLIASLVALDPEQRLMKIVHHVGSLPTALESWLAHHGVLTQEIAPYGAGPAAYCNKLQQFEHLMKLNVSHLVMCDADLFFLSSPELLVFPGNVRARVVDAPNPGPEALRHLLGAAGFGAEQLSARPHFQQNTVTHRLNCNGGMYVLDREQLKELAPVWRQWSGYCLSREDILGKKVLHADQLGFMLAMLETGLPFHELPGHANFPTHFPAEHYPQAAQEISSLHYHGNVLDDGSLGTVGVIEIDACIEAANVILYRGGLTKAVGGTYSPILATGQGDGTAC